MKASPAPGRRAGLPLLVLVAVVATAGAGAADPGGETGYDVPEFRTPDVEWSYDVNWTPNHEIAFKSGSLTPDPGLDPDLANADGPTWVLLQFHEEQPRRHVEALDGFEITVAENGTLSRTAVYARVPGDQLEDLADADPVRSVREIRPAWKKAPAIDRLQDEGELGPDTEHRIYVTGFGPLEDERLEVYDRAGHGYFGNLTMEGVEELSNRSRVRWLTSYEPPSLDLSESRQGISALGTVGSDRLDQVGPVTGAGVRVGVVDTGVQLNHPHFESVTIIEGTDHIGKGSPNDPDGHGTHVASTIAGRTRVGATDAAPDLGLTGVAPEATLVASRYLRPEEETGFLKPESALVPQKKVFNDVVTHGDVDVISNSWGSNMDDGDYNKWTHGVDYWAKRHQETLLVFSHGNAPGDAHPGNQARGVNVLSVSAVQDGSKDGSHPSYDRKKNQAITASNAKNTSNTSTLLTKMNPPTAVAKDKTEQIKPELLAPGVGIHAATNENGYSVKMGSSMAAPHVSGVAALLEDAYTQDLNANELRTLLVHGAAPSRGGSGSYYTKGFGVVNAQDSLWENPDEHEYGVVVPEEGGLLKKGGKFATVTVPDDATRVSATLSWIDPLKCSCTHTLLSNELWLVLGPKGQVPDPSTQKPGPWEQADPYVNSASRNVKQVVIDDPPSGQWLVGAYGRYVTLGNRQPYAIAYTVSTDDPGIRTNVDGDGVGPRTKKVHPTVTVEGTGAPASGIHAWVKETPGFLETCTPKPPGYVVGTLHKDDQRSVDLCLRVDNQNLPADGDYKVPVGVAWSGGERTVDVPIEVDTKPPGQPGNLRLLGPSKDLWRTDPLVGFLWEPPSDASRYRVVYTTSPDTTPWEKGNPPPGTDVEVENVPGGPPNDRRGRWQAWLGPYSSPRVPSDVGNARGANITPDLLEGHYWIHVRAVDIGDNPGPTAHLGPVKVDLTDPTASLEGPEVVDPDEVATYTATGEDPPEEPPDDLDRWNWKVCEEGTFGDPGCGILHVEPAEDDTHRFEVDWSDWENGTYTIELQLHDVAGQRGLGDLTVTVGQPPAAPGPGWAWTLVATVAAATGLRRRSRRGADGPDP